MIMVNKYVGIKRMIRLCRKYMHAYIIYSHWWSTAQIIIKIINTNAHIKIWYLLMPYVYCGVIV